MTNAIHRVHYLAQSRSASSHFADRRSSRFPGRSALRLVLVALAAFILGPRLTFSQEDYFSPKRNQQHLNNVEKYHLNHVPSPQSLKPGSIRYAIDDLAFVLNHFPNHPKALLLMGWLAREMKKPSLAAGYYEKALRLYPQHALTYAQYGEFLNTSGSSMRALSLLERAISMDDRLPVAHAWLAETYFKLGDSQKAESAARRARELGYSGPIAGETTTRASP